MTYPISKFFFLGLCIGFLGRKFWALFFCVLIFSMAPLLATYIEKEEEKGSYTHRVINTNISELMEEARKGRAEAQYNLGLMYHEGREVEQSYKEAVEWYAKSATQGFPSAQHNLGFMYAEGRGIEQNDEEAVKWFRKAAEQGFTSAQYKLDIVGLFYNAPKVDLVEKISGKSQEDYEFIATQISKNKIEELDLSKNNIEEEGFEVLVKAIANHPTLKRLTLRGDCLDSMKAMILLKGLETSKITDLDLSHNQINGWGIINIGSFLKNNQALENLDLSFNPIESKIAPQIQEGLVDNKSLKSLKLRKIGLNGVGFSKIAEGLCPNTTLEDLDLSENSSLGDEGAISLRLLLSENKGIKHIDISKCSFSTFGLKKVEQGLMENNEINITPPRDYLKNMRSLSEELDEGNEKAVNTLVEFYKKAGTNLKKYLSDDEIQDFHDKAGKILFNPKPKVIQLPSNEEFYKVIQDVLG